MADRPARNPHFTCEAPECVAPKEPGSDGPAERRVRTDVPDRIPILPGEAELVHLHLKNCLAELFAT